MTAEDHLSFGGRLRQMRINRRLLQRDLVGEHLSSSYISLLETDRRAPTERVVIQLAEKLGCQPSELWSGTLGQAGHDSEAALELKIAETALLVGELAEAEKRYRHLLEIPVTDPQVVQGAYLGIACCLERSQRYTEALDFYLVCIQDDAKNAKYACWLTPAVGLVRCLLRLREHTATVQWVIRNWEYLEAENLTESDAAVELCAMAAVAHIELADYAAADQMISRAMRITSQLESQHARINVYWKACLSAHGRDLRGFAIDYGGRIEQILRDDDWGHIQGMLHGVHGTLLLIRNQPDPQAAVETLTAAIAHLTAAGETPEALSYQIELARAFLMLGSAATAATMAGEVRNNPLARPIDGIRACIVQAAALSCTGDREETVRACSAASAALVEMPPSPSSSRLWSQLGEVYVRIGDADAAVLAYRRAMDSLGVTPPPSLLMPLSVRQAVERART